MIGGPMLRQYVVEFVPGVGIRTNGQVDTSQGTAGPFLWTVPDGVASLMIGMTGGGAGGSGGGAFSAGVISAGGGAGGASGVSLVSQTPAAVVPKTVLQITLGAAGTGGAVGALNTGGGNTFVKGYLTDPGILGAYHYGVAGQIHTWGGAAHFGNAAGQTSTTTFAAGGNSGGHVNSNGFGVGGNQAAGSGSDGGGSAGFTQAAGCLMRWHSIGGGGGAAGAASGGVNGGSNLYSGQGSDSNFDLGRSGGEGLAGSNNGTYSQGAGGTGAGSHFGRGGNGGAGGGNGSVGFGYGAGGGGGGGGGAGANGTPGYVQFTYWKAD